MKRSILAATAAVAVVLTVAACGDKPKTATGGTFTSVDSTHAINVSAPINPYNGASNAYAGYNAMRLGWPKNDLQDLNQFYPGVAKTWDVSSDGNKVTVHIQPKAKWSDGTPVTGEDIKTSAAVAFTQGGSVFSFVAGAGPSGALNEVKVVDEKTVEFSQAPGAKNTTFLNGLLQMWVLPKSVFGPQLPADFWDILKKSSSTADKAAATAAQEQITSLGKKLVAFGPEKDVSCGPFVLQSKNPSEVLLVKNKNFFDADKIGPEKVKLRNYADNQAIWNYLIGGELDAAPYTSTPTDVVNQILAKPNSKKIKGLSQVSAALVFNESYTPFDKVQVRQALAYIIDRAQVQKIGEPDSGKPAEHTTGLIEDAAKKWLGAEAVGKLNPYNVDKSKAEALLTQAGLSKKDGKWMMADGKPFAFKIQAPAPFSDWVAGAKNIASQLTDFGIAAEAQTSADYATYQKEMADGKYAAGLWLVGLGPSTYNAYLRLYGPANGWANFAGALSHNPPKTKGNWIGMPETADVSGLGTVNPGELTFKLSQTPVAEQKDTILKLAQFTNDQLPAIQIWNYINVQFVNETRFTNFPPNDCPCLRQPAGVWMQLGYIGKK